MKAINDLSHLVSRELGSVIVEFGAEDIASHVASVNVDLLPGQIPSTYFSLLGWSAVLEAASTLPIDLSVCELHSHALSASVHTIQPGPVEILVKTGPKAWDDGENGYIIAVANADHFSAWYMLRIPQAGNWGGTSRESTLYVEPSRADETAEVNLSPVHASAPVIAELRAFSAIGLATVRKLRGDPGTLLEATAEFRIQLLPSSKLHLEIEFHEDHVGVAAKSGHELAIAAEFSFGPSDPRLQYFERKEGHGFRPGSR